MKRCSYCGRENEDALENCTGCGTVFPSANVRTSASLVELLRTPAGSAIGTFLAVLLLCGGLFTLGGVLVAQIMHVRGKLPDANFNNYTIFTSMWAAPVLALTGIVPIFSLYRGRFAPKSRADRLAALTLCTVAAFGAAPWVEPLCVMLWFPLGLLLIPLGKGACYAGALTQVLGSFVFLYWIRPRATEVLKV